jgi:hypothetical protein
MILYLCAVPKTKYVIFSASLQTVLVGHFKFLLPLPEQRDPSEAHLFLYVSPSPTLPFSSQIFSRALILLPQNGAPRQIIRHVPEHYTDLTAKMEELYYRRKTNAPMDFIFTTNTGQIVEIKAEDLPVTSPYSPNYHPSLMAPSNLDGKMQLPAQVVRYLKTKSYKLPPWTHLHR